MLYEENKNRTGLCQIRGEKKVLAQEVDKKKFLDCLQNWGEEEQIRIYAFCILDDSVSLLLEAKIKRDLEEAVRNLLDTYQKTCRKERKITNLAVQEIEWLRTDEELVRSCLMMHAKPVQLNAAKTARDFWWSSCQTYEGLYQWTFLSTEKIWTVLSENPNAAVRLFRKYQKNAEKGKFILAKRILKEEIKDDMIRRTKGRT